MSEVNDRNKTTLTHDVTRAAQAWLDAKGFKPVETEVTVAPGWCADLAGVIVPTQTELIDLKLLRRRPPYNWRNEAAQTVAWATWQGEFVRLDRIMTCAVEVKTSRGDFRGDRKWEVAQPTDLAYLVVPSGLIREDEWPGGWGILSYTENGVRQLRPPTPRYIQPVHQRDVILNIAVRRDHHTRHARLRELRKVQRHKEADARPVSRLGDVSRLVVEITEGRRPLDQLLGEYRFEKIPSYMKERLATLYGCRTAVVQGEAQ